MALPYPEGEVVFLRSVLRTASFNADNSRDFYGNALVEVVWNAYYSVGQRGQLRPPTQTNPLSNFAVMTASTWRTAFGRYEHLTFQYGPARNRIRREHRLATVGNFWEYRDFDMGQAKVGFIPVPMPTLADQFMWIDQAIPIRAIYFPLAERVSDRFAHLCSYLMLDFRQGTLRILSVPQSGSGGSWVDRRLNITSGINAETGRTLRIDVGAVYELLALPRHERAPDKAVSHPGRLIQLHVTERSQPPPSGPAVWVSRGEIHVNHFVDLVTILNAHQGVNLQYAPSTFQPWIRDMFVGFASVAIGLIPGIGPLLAVSFDIAMSAILNPDAFRSQNPLELAPALLDAVINTALNTRSNVRPGRLEGAIGKLADVPGEDESDVHDCTGWLEARLPPAPEKEIPPHPEEGGDEYDYQTSIVTSDSVEEPQTSEHAGEDQTVEPAGKEQAQDPDAEEHKGA